MVFRACLAAFLPGALCAQPRITYNGHQLFLSGANIAWVNFAADVGPETADLDAFRTMFDSVHASGGNSMRFWLHTNCVNTPRFDANGKVTGPGENVIANLTSILDLASQRDVGLILCLWSFDMLRISFGPAATNRAQLMLTDTAALRAYVDNALVPMVMALKGHPGIIAWEVFNEPEGMSNEHGWNFTYHVPMANIQRFINRVAGAIHRADSATRVTTGAWSFIALSDVTPAAKPVHPASLTEEEIETIESEFFTRYGNRMPADSILSRFSVAGNMNYYRDDRLVAAGGDSLGTLDFYTVHYYDWAGTALSPFHHPAGTWSLTKPLVVSEFFLEPAFGIPGEELYPRLHATGYAGAMSWQWYQNAAAQLRTRDAMRNLLVRYPEDVWMNPVSGMILAFTASPAIVSRGDYSTLEWSTAPGSSATLNDSGVTFRGRLPVAPETTTTYRLKTSGTVRDSQSVTIQVLPPANTPAGPQLMQNYPNPFSSITTIMYRVAGVKPESATADPGSGHVHLAVYDVLGREVMTVVDAAIAPGEYRTQFYGSRLAGGVYFYRLRLNTAGECVVQTKKMMLAK